MRRTGFKRKVTKLMKKKPLTTSKLKKKLDTIFSRYIRMKYSDTLNGIVRCYTCGYLSHWKKMQNGHMVSRYYLNTRFDERNCRPQCFTCNMYRNGMIPDFSQNLEKELGEGITKLLFKEANKIVFDFPYLEKIKFYEGKVNELSKLVP